MSDLDELAETVGFDQPSAAKMKGPRSALRMRNVRKQQKFFGTHNRAILASSLWSKRRKPTLPKLKFMEGDGE